jgi:hypothetical protein
MTPASIKARLRAAASILPSAYLSVECRKYLAAARTEVAYRNALLREEEAQQRTALTQLPSHSRPIE